jgi:hypothetical protein
MANIIFLTRINFSIEKLLLSSYNFPKRLYNLKSK